jgi:hypothetical protein
MSGIVKIKTNCKGGGNGKDGLYYRNRGGKTVVTSMFALAFERLGMSVNLFKLGWLKMGKRLRNQIGVNASRFTSDEV